MITGTELARSQFEVDRDEFASALPAGELVVLSRHLGSAISEYYAGELRQDRAETLGRLSVEATNFSKIKMDLFITDIHITNWGDDRLVGGNGSDKVFNIKYPIEYANFTPITISEDEPGYIMDRPHDFAPIVSREINPVSLIVGRDGFLKRLTDYLTRSGVMDQEGRDAIRLRAEEVFSNQDSTTDDVNELFAFTGITRRSAFDRLRAQGQI